MATIQQHRVQVLLDGVSVDAPSLRHRPQFHQELIQRAKERYGNALCTCQGRPLNLVIRERAGRLFLAAWPDQASKHALDCPFYSDHKDLYGPGAIVRNGDVTSVQLTHALVQPSRHSTRSTAQIRTPGSGNPVERKKPKESMHMWGLLHFLWEEGGLNRWHPGWHRDWGLVRYMLRRVAQSTMIESRPLLESLYVPPVWNPAQKAVIKDNWRMFCEPLEKNHRRSDMVASAFVIGTVRNLIPTEFGHAIELHHHAHRFYLDKFMSDNAAQYSRRGWAAAKQLEMAGSADTKPYVVAAMRVEASSTGVMTVVEIALMRVSPRYIPVDSSYEDRLVQRLLEQDRQFIKPLHYDKHHMAFPDFILKDAQEKDMHGVSRQRSVAMYVYGAAISAQQKPKMEAADRKYAEQAGLGYWQWDVAQNKEVPALPEAFERPQPAVADAEKGQEPTSTPA